MLLSYRLGTFLWTHNEMIDSDEIKVLPTNDLICCHTYSICSSVILFRSFK
jgi:hypothetical protein